MEESDHQHHTRRDGRVSPDQVDGLGDGAVQLKRQETGHSSTKGGKEPSEATGLSVAIEQGDDYERWNSQDGPKDKTRHRF